MAYIIMGIDECGTEVRAVDTEFSDAYEAQEVADMFYESRPEWRSVWVEQVKEYRYFLDME